MGSYISRRRRRTMNEDDSDTGEMGSEQGGDVNIVRGSDPDLATILSYLIRSGQVRVLQSGSRNFGDDDNDEDAFYSGDDDPLVPDSLPQAESNPDTSALANSQLKQEIELQSGQSSSCRRGTAKPSISKLLQQREVGMGGKQGFTPADCRSVNSCYLPNWMDPIANYCHKAFCGTYSQDGSIFLSACQDRCIRIYDATQGRFKLFKTIQAKDVGWSVLDTAFSPDGSHLVYSSWSDCIHLCNIYGDQDTHDALHLFPGIDHSFCIFSLCFSQDNQEILGGANDGCIYVYDRIKNERTLKIDAHDDDVNAVAYADCSSHILFSGGDDGLCKVWDRRTLNEDRPVPVGVLAGHSDGITFIDSKGDGRYLVSNCKDQTIKLWDMRSFSSKQAQRETKQAVANQKWDYRWQQVPSRVTKKAKVIRGDSSLMTYRGHSVLNTLIRCRFSPSFTTGQRYIYSGCASGAVVIYDVLTGKIEKRLGGGHRACVRDVSWHPYENNLISTSWDSTIGLWTYRTKPDITASWESDSDLDIDSDDCLPRRSSRLQEQKQRQRLRLGNLFRD